MRKTSINALLLPPLLIPPLLIPPVLLGAAMGETNCASAAQATLRARAVAQAPLVRLGDVADIKGDTSPEVARLAAVILTTAPTPGAVRHFRAAEIRDLAAAQGVDVSDLQVDGAIVVEVRRGNSAFKTENSATSGLIDDSVPSREITPAERLTLQEALRAYLERQTQHALWQVELTTKEAPLDRLTSGQGRWSIDGGRSPWTGRQSFTLVAPVGQTSFALQARVTRQEMAVIVVRPIDRGDLVRASDVELQPIEGALPAQAVGSVETAMGQEARQSLRPGALLLANQLRAPIVVRRGEPVTVFARAAGIVVKTQAVARQDGSVGELVAVETLDGSRRERLNARVTGRQQLEIYAAGVRSDDFVQSAALASDNSAEAR